MGCPWESERGLKGNECDPAWMLPKPTRRQWSLTKLYNDNKIPHYSMLVILGMLVYLLNPDVWTLEVRRRGEVTLKSMTRFHSRLRRT
jgi:hypothetical protein